MGKGRDKRRKRQRPPVLTLEGLQRIAQVNADTERVGEHVREVREKFGLDPLPFKNWRASGVKP